MEERVEEIMERFNFNKVLDAMERCNWEWATKRGMKVPKMYELMECARYLLQKAYEEKTTVSTGGFTAECKGEDSPLSLCFVLEEYELD